MRALDSVRRHAADPLYANGYALVANAGLSSLLGFAFWLVAARRFPPDALGVGAAVVSAASLAALVGKAGFDAAVIRYAPACGREGLRRLLLTCALATGAITLFTAASLLGLAWLGIEALHVLLDPVWGTGFLLLAAGTACAWILDAFYISEQRAGHVLARNLAFNGVKLLVPLFLVAAWAGRAVPLAWLVGLAASLVVATAALPRRIATRRPGADDADWRTIGSYAARNWALNLSEFLPGLLLPILVLDAMGAEANARFFLAWTAATVLFLAAKAIAQSAFAALVRRATPAIATRKALLQSLVLLGPGVVVLWAAPGFVLGLFGPAYGGDGVPLLRLLALSVIPLAVAHVFLAHLKATDAGLELTLLPLLSLGAMVIAMPLALHTWGIIGVGAAWLTIQSLVGTYAAVRLVAVTTRAKPASPRRTPHEG